MIRGLFNPRAHTLKNIVIDVEELTWHAEILGFSGVEVTLGAWDGFAFFILEAFPLYMILTKADLMNSNQ